MKIIRSCFVIRSGQPYSLISPHWSCVSNVTRHKTLTRKQREENGNLIAHLLFIFIRSFLLDSYLSGARSFSFRFVSGGIVKNREGVPRVLEKCEIMTTLALMAPLVNRAPVPLMSAHAHSRVRFCVRVNLCAFTCLIMDA